MSHPHFIQYTRTVINSEKLQQILEPVEKFADSFGLQPFRILVIPNDHSDPYTKDKYSTENWQVIFAIRNEITKKDIDDFINNIRQNKKYSSQSLNKYRTVFEDSINIKSEKGESWSERQARAGLAILLSAAGSPAIQIHFEELNERSFLNYQSDHIPAGYVSKIVVQISWKSSENILIGNDGEAFQSAASYYN